MRTIMAVVISAVLVLTANFAIAGDSATVDVSANVPGNCMFNSGGTMDFGALDPAVGGNVNAVVAQPQFWCTKNAAYSLADDDGLNESGTTHQLIDAVSGDLIPYTFAYTASGSGAGKNSPITMDIAGTSAGADYVDKSEGNYSDTVTLTITP